MPWFVVEPGLPDFEVCSIQEAVRHLRRRKPQIGVDNRSHNQVIDDWRSLQGHDLKFVASGDCGPQFKLPEGKWVSDNGPC